MGWEGEWVGGGGGGGELWEGIGGLRLSWEENLERGEYFSCRLNVKSLDWEGLEICREDSWGDVGAECGFFTVIVGRWRRFRRRSLRFLAFRVFCRSILAV